MQRLELDILVLWYNPILLLRDQKGHMLFVLKDWEEFDKHVER
jgi:hypothetical protein